MDYKYYERKINDIIMKCPIEAGVEILIYNVLDSIILSEELALVDISRIWKSKDERLVTDGGVPDIAVLSNDFEFGTNTGKAFGFIEVKATNILLSETTQIDGHKKSNKNFIYTNGLVWIIYPKNQPIKEIFLTTDEYKYILHAKTITIKEKKFKELLEELEKIEWQN